MEKKPLPLALFGAATLIPVALLFLGVLMGGFWLWAGFLYMAGLAVLLDQLLPLFGGNPEELEEFPGSDEILAAVGVAHLVMLPLAVWAVAGPSGHGTVERLILFLGSGYWFGQVAHPAAHELIHNGDKRLFRLGVAVYTTLLIGHHASAHRLVHHRAVATPEDPSSAPPGMGFWTFAPRAWIGSFRAGWMAEDMLRAKIALGGGTKGMHPYHVYLGGAAASLLVGWLIAGLPGTLAWLGLAAHAQLQMSLADYVQHYGLRRRQLDDGRYEPVADRHSWNTPHWFSSALMMNAPRHSDHHAHPLRPYPELRLSRGAPMLPWPLPVACAIAMVPRIWKRRMKPLVAEWSA